MPEKPTTEELDKMIVELANYNPKDDGVEMTDWELDFVASTFEKRKPKPDWGFSPKQAAVIKKTWEKVFEA